jgi:autotransporter-associated beta strand protein
MNCLRSLTLCVGVLIMIIPVRGQQSAADIFSDPAVDMKSPDGRAKAVAKIKAIEDARATRTRAKAKALGLKMRIEKPDGGVKEIVDFEGDRPIYIETKNLNAAISTAANLVQVSPYSLDGTGIIAGVWDGGSVRSTHQEFANGSRVAILDGAAANNHATHVGGTIGAQGTSANAKGMATNVSIASYDWNSDQSEMTSRAATAANQFGTKIYVSNHSYGYSDGWDGNTWGGNGTDQNAADYSFGQYDATARSLDGLMYNSPYYIAFWAAGNDGTDNPTTGATVTIGGVSVAYNPAIHPPGDGVYRNGFETIGSHGIAKNLITIGAANDAVTSSTRDPAKSTLTGFSSTGPTDDGRIKPDLVANGASLTSTSSSGDAGYTGMSGTSMASPNATGSAVLVVDQYKRLFNSAMRASTLKGLLIHTATDIGNPGPDYKYGWGLVDTKKAVDLIRDHHAFPVKTRIIEDQVTTSTTTRTHSFLWDGASPLRATACWTDPVGASTTAHDSRTARLVNNLNLKLIAPNGTEYFPYVMPFVGTWTVASMSQNATTGVNNTDNVETVLIQSPGLNGTWQAVISYSGALTNNSQAYGLILSGTSDSPNTVNVTSPNGGETFYRESPYTITWASNVSGNVSIELLKGGALHSVLSANEANDGSFTWSVPSSLTLAADYTIRISSVNNPSYTDTSAATFTIAANPWSNALDTVGIPWNSPGAQPWFSQATTTNDGVDAAQSGAIGDDGSSALEATITGPGTLTFYWKVSSESGYDFLRFYLNGVEQTGSLAKISGNVNWVQKTVTIPAGTNTIQWTYSKDVTIASGSDAAWVDQVVFTPDAEIVVEQPIGTVLVDGSATVNFGSVNTGSSAPLTFTIRNTGSLSLTGVAVTKSGTNSGDFTFTNPPATLSSGANTTFTVTFAPGVAGARTAALQIASNDADENPFDIILTGTGVGPGTLAVTPAGGLTSSGTYGGSFSPASIDYTLSNPGSTSINWTAGKTQDWVTLSAASGTLAAGATATVTASINSNANSLNVGSYSDTVTFTNTTSGTGNTTRGASLTVNPIPVTVSLSNLLQIYNGTPRPVTVTTNPTPRAYSVTYDGSSTAPTNGGTYAVVATITEPNHVGTASGNLTIAYNVTYQGNGNTSGTLPADQTKYHGVDLSLATNSGNLNKTDYSFAGWNTAADGGGTSYPAGVTYSGNASLILYAQWVPGADGTWIQSTAGPFNWGESLNWSSGTVAAGADRTASFTPNITAAQAVNLDSARTIGNITFTDSSNASHDLTISGANTLTLARTSGVPTINVTQSGRKLSISSKISGTNGLKKDGAGTLALIGTNDYSGGTVISSGSVNLGTNSDANLGATSGGLTFTGTANITYVDGLVLSANRSVTINTGATVSLSNAITVNGILTGAGAFSVNTADGFYFTNANNDFSGTITAATAGSTSYGLDMASIGDGSGAGLINLNNGTFRWIKASGGTTTFANRQFSLSGTTAGGVISARGNSSAENLIITKDLLVTGDGNKSLTLAGTNTGLNTFSGNIANGNVGGTTDVISLIKSEAGTWILSGTNTYSGATQFSGQNSGTLIFSGAAAASSNSTFQLREGCTIALRNETAGTVAFGAPMQVNLQSQQTSGRASSTINVDRIIAGSGSTLAIGKLNFAGITDNRAGGATVTVTGANGYKLQIASIDLDWGINGSQNINPTSAPIIVTGTVQHTNGRPVTGTTVEGVAIGNGGMAFVLEGTATNNVISGAIKNATDYDDSSNSNALPLNLTKANTTGVWTLSGSNTYTGGTTVSGGTLEIGGSGTLGNGNYAGNISIASTNSGNLKYNSSADQILGGVISGGGALVKENTGTLTLTNANNYTGITTVSGGKLFINGSLSDAAVALNVSSGATLGGTGTVGRNATIASGGKLEFAISTVATSHNSLDVSAGRSFAFSGASELTITSTGGLAAGIYTLITGGNNITGIAPATVHMPEGWAATASISGSSLLLHVMGLVDHFAISPISSPRMINEPITGITITAQHASNQAVANFTGTVAFGGTAGITGTSANFTGGVLSGVSITPTTAGNNLTFTVHDGSGHTGSATFSVQTLYGGWSGGTFANSFTDTALASNPDGDSLNNLQEFAFGTDPTASVLRLISFDSGGAVTAPGIPKLMNFAAAGQAADFRAVFGRRKDHVAAGLNYAVHFSADMTMWTASGTTPTVLTGATNPGDIEAVSVPYPSAVPVTGGGAAQPPKFFRVLVTQ